MARLSYNARISRGFTLVEVLVALVVVAVGVAAVIESTTGALSATQDLEETTFASWIASNVITEYRITGRWELKTEEEERTFAGREWPIRIAIQRAEAEQLRGRIRVIRVTVFDPANNEQSVRTMEARLHNEQQSP
jgi:general secretion pathway protein I